MRILCWCSNIITTEKQMKISFFLKKIMTNEATSSVDNGSPFQTVVSISFLFKMCSPQITSLMDLN